MNSKKEQIKADRYPTVDGRPINNDEEYADYIKERMVYSATKYGTIHCVEGGYMVDTHRPIIIK